MERKEATIEVPTQGGGPPPESKEPVIPPGPNPELVDDKKPAGDELSAEDRALKERLELAVERAQDPDAGVALAALQALRSEIRGATSSMTSVPKPFKFLAPHFAPLRALFDSARITTDPAPVRQLLADVLSVLAMTMGREGARETLKYKFSGDLADIGDWGSEYVRHLAGEIGQEYEARREADPAAAVEDLLGLVRTIIPYDMKHNAEVEAVDLCLETEQLSLLTAPGMVDDASHGRVCLYLLKCSAYLGDTADAEAVQAVAFTLYLQHKQYTQALIAALRMGGPKTHERVDTVFAACEDAGVRKQMGHLLGRHRMMGYIAKDDEVNAAIGNQSLSTLFASLARDLDVVEAKTPEDIYKTHLTGAAERGAGAAAAPESAKSNLASTYVNAWVNAGFGADKLVSPVDSQWVFRNRDSGQMAAAASLGLVCAWDETRLDALDKYLNAEEEPVRAGAILGLALMTTGTRNLDVDPMLALLSMHIEEGNTSGPNMKIAALLGLGLVYAGSAREDVANLLTPYIQTESGPANPHAFEAACMAALALGMVFVGSAKEDAASVIADRLMSSTPLEQGSAIARHMALGLGLLFLGQGEAVDAMLEILGVIEQPTLSAVAKTLVKACAYAGTGSVLTMQELLRVCAAHPEAEDKERAEKEKEDAANAAAAAAAGAGAGAAGGAGAGAAAARAGAGAGAAGAGTAGAGAGTAAEDEAAAKHGAAAAGKYLHQSAAVLGLALVAMGEELSVDMATRMADHLLQYGDTSVRRMVPLALALLHVSDPEYGIVDILSKLSHDPNVETAQAAVFGMGLVSAGTNNSRVAGLLRTLATFYRSEPNTLFVVRLAQGLTHMGKGLLTLNPIHADRNLVSPVAISGILSALLLFMDSKTSLHGASKWHILLYTLSTAIHPRFLTTTDEAGAPLPVEVRVGAAVETVGQAGRPKTITGFQTHTTPVLVGVRDRAELVDDAASGGQWYPLTPILENVIILRRNPHYKPRPGAGTAGGAGKVGSSAAAAGAGKPAAAGAGAGAGAGR